MLLSTTNSKVDELAIAAEKTIAKAAADFRVDVPAIVIRLHSSDVETSILERGFDHDLQDHDLFDDLNTGASFEDIQMAVTLSAELKRPHNTKYRGIVDKRVQLLESSLGFHMAGLIGLVPGYPFPDEELKRRHDNARRSYMALLIRRRRGGRREEQPQEAEPPVDGAEENAEQEEPDLERPEAEQRRHFKMLRNAVLERATFICTTTANYTANENKVDPAVIVIDEACRDSEVNTELALRIMTAARTKCVRSDFYKNSSHTYSSRVYIRESPQHEMR